MDMIVAFRNLVTNQFMPEFNYSDTFPFYKTAYSYVCCSCAFQHEFFTYLSEDGTLDESVYETIASYIACGRCTHVCRDVPNEWVRETSVSGLQLAVALGTKQEEQENMERGRFAITRINEGIFQLSLHNIALSRKKYENLEWYLGYFTITDLLDFIDNDYVLFCHQPNGVHNIFEVKQITIIEALIQTRNIGVIQDILLANFLLKFGDIDNIFYGGLMKAFEYSLKHRLEAIATVLVEYTKCFGSVPLRSYLLVAIMYNRPEMLDCLLNIISDSDISAAEMIKEMLCLTCEVLKRKECTKVLMKHDITIWPDDVTDLKRIEFLLGLIDNENFYEDFGNEIVAALNVIPNVQYKCIASISKMVNSMTLTSNVVKTILELGPDNFDQAFVSKVLTFYGKNTRPILELLLGANIETQDSTDTVEIGLTKDLYRFQLWGAMGSKDGVYYTDVIERDVYTQEDYDLAMNLSGPFLLECGFKASKDYLTTYLNKLSSPKLEHTECMRRYLQDYLENLKRLAVMSKDTIRRYYKGRSLHTYLCSIQCPEKIKDFILLKHLFKSEVAFKAILKDMDITK